MCVVVVVGAAHELITVLTLAVHSYLIVGGYQCIPLSACYHN